MTNKEERPAGCVLRLFGAPEQTVQKAVEALPDTWQGTVHCRSRGAETLVALQSSTPQQLHRAVSLHTSSLRCCSSACTAAAARVCSPSPYSAGARLVRSSCTARCSCCGVQ